MPLSGGGAPNPDMCSDLESNQKVLGARDNAQSTEANIHLKKYTTGDSAI